MADKTEKKSKGFFAGVKRFFGRIGKFFRLVLYICNSCGDTS